MLRYPLTHPEILDALGSAGHGSRVLLADANYPFRTAAGPHARLVYLNVRPGLVGVVDMLAVLSTAVVVEEALVMLPETGPEPEVFAAFRQLLPDLELPGVPRQAFYAAARSEDVALVIATGEQRLYANILLTLGVAAG
ncbi:RbsD/FucU family protein [Microlunatus spumicola]|uniref:RbsD/FucU family protein n=1 Tax=Microlunatus spumicola TaxID=81499 RepID=A0ABP6WU22_9ACTN